MKQPTIPNIFHFIYVGGRAFSFVHYLAVLTAYKVNRPDIIYLHYTELPSGHWWDMALPMLTLHAVEPVVEIYGNPVKYPAHKADIIRLSMLRKLGGVYLDLDVISINRLEPLMKNNFVMGIESGTGLCNAVIMSAPDAPFLKLWQDAYRDFDGNQWNRHSVVLPWQMARTNPDKIHVEDQYSFFYPTHNDPVHKYLWGARPTFAEVCMRTAKSVIRLLLKKFSSRKTGQEMICQTFHILRGASWHYRQLQKSYCIHLWEGLWGQPYLNKLTPDFLLQSNSHFARVMREQLTRDEILKMK